MAHHHIDLEKSTSAAPSKIANPGPLGLFSFASTTFILSLYNLQTRDITHPNVVVGMAIFCGGLAQLLAGMWEFPKGNAFGATAFTSYGAFWMSYATILLPGSGVLAAFTDPTELSSALGIYLMAWFMVTFLLLIVSLRKNVGLVVLFSCLTITFLLLAIGIFTASLAVTKSGGALGVVTAFVAYYVGLAELLSADNVHLPLGKLN
jgi:succinate-acetate transporter protein